MSGTSATLREGGSLFRTMSRRRSLQAGVLGWLKQLGRRRSADPVTYPPIDAGTVIYAVGDIHGRSDLLDGVHSMIDADFGRRIGKRQAEIYLGDYVDRGPDSAGVLARLRRRAEARKVIAISGNHEDTLLGFLEGRIAAREWLEWGGAATALSYGVNPQSEAVLGAAVARAVPLEDVAFLRGLRLAFHYGPYFFAHAGVRPGRPLEKQVADDLMWIRKPFLSHAGGFGAIVVHGHTPRPAPELLGNRINLDTGAYATGRLACLRIDDTGAALLEESR